MIAYIPGGHRDMSISIFFCVGVSACSTFLLDFSLMQNLEDYMGIGLG